MVISRSDVEILKEKFHKFSKIQKCMIENPEYGVELSTSARRYLQKRKGIKPKRKKKYLEDWES